MITADPLQPSFEPLGHFQLRIMQTIWALPAGSTVTITDIASVLNRALPRQLAYTTYLTVMRNLSRRGVLKQTKATARAHVFAPLISKRDYEWSMLRNIRETFYNGSGADMNISVTEFCGSE